MPDDFPGLNQLRQAKMFGWLLRIWRKCREYLAADQRAIEIGKAVIGPAHDAVPEDVPEDLVRAVPDSCEAGSKMTASVGDLRE